ncbi:MAG TPA: hypothetical protein VFW53_11890 [Gallionella sp.]|nr:hypothetical protein [Gallionella sp.]
MTGSGEQAFVVGDKQQSACLKQPGAQSMQAIVIYRVFNLQKKAPYQMLDAEKIPRMAFDTALRLTA